MPIELCDLVKYNCAVETQDENAESPSPVLLLNKYRVRVVDVKKLPILNNFANFQALGCTSDNILLIDSPISEKKKESKKEIDTISSHSENEKVDENEKMDVDDNKENGPLQTSFLTLEKLKKDTKGGGENEEIVGYSFENQYFDCNPVTVPESIEIQNILRTTNNLLNDEVSKMPKWVSTTSSDLPLISWHTSGRTSKNVMYTGVTRVLGYFNENSEKEVRYLNHAFDSRNYTHFNRCRAVYDVIRRYKTENRQDPGEIVVDMRWNTSKDTELLSQSMNSTECTIKIDLGWCDSRFYTDRTLFNELFFVLNLADVLTNPGNEVNFSAHWQTFDDLVIEMNEMIEKCAEDENNFAVKNDKEEVTEKVWNILQKCSDIKQVTVLLKTFLQAMMYGRIKSQVHDNNRSHLAQLIKSSKHGTFRMPRLERLNTIEILMEIGVESLRRRIVEKFVSSLAFPEEELEMLLTQCEKELNATHGDSESRAFGLLPFAMALATVVQVNSLLKEDDKTLILDITRKVLSKYTNNLRSDNKNGQLNSVYVFETTLPFSRLNQSSFLQKRPRVWTCETNVTIGGTTAAKIMACLQLEVPLEHVSNMVNAVRPVKKIEENEKASLEDKNADYTVSHTLITYHPKF